MPRGFELQNFRPSFGGDHRGTLGGRGVPAKRPPPLQTPPPLPSLLIHPCGWGRAGTQQHTHCNTHTRARTHTPGAMGSLQKRNPPDSLRVCTHTPADFWLLAVWLRQRHPRCIHARGCHKDAHPPLFLLWHPLSDVLRLPTNRHRLPTNRHLLHTNRHRPPTNRHCRAYWTLRVFFFHYGTP